MANRILLAVVSLGAMSTMACSPCGFGGPGCGDPVVAGLCGETLFVGDERLVLFGYLSDTGVSEATVLGVHVIDAGLIQAEPMPGSPDVPGTYHPPFDSNNGPGDGGVRLLALSPGTTDVLVDLQGWDEPVVVTLDVAPASDAPDSYPFGMPVQNLLACLDGE